MTITARFYTGADDLAKVQEFIAQTTLAEGDMSKLHVGDFPHRLYNGQRKYPQHELVQLWEEADGALLAWAMVYPKSSNFDFQVRASHQHTPLAREVLDWAIQHLHHWLVRIEAEDPEIHADAFEGDVWRMQLLESAGFYNDVEAEPFYSTSRPLSDPIPPLNLPDGFSIRSVAGEHEAGKVGAVHSAAFDSDWTEEEYRTLMGTPGYDMSRELVVVTPDGDFAAFTVMWYDHLNKTGLFEPVGADARYRRMGLTRQLMYEGMRRMQAAGLETALVQYEGDNEASTALYTSAGFKIKYNVLDYILEENT
ncbi:MAG: hypothetical protein OHK0046_26410 [Anaerolineae bacterium]